MDSYVEGEIQRVYIPHTTKMAVFKLKRPVCVHEFQRVFQQVSKIAKQIKEEGCVTVLVDPSFMDCEIVPRDIPQNIMN